MKILNFLKKLFYRETPKTQEQINLEQGLDKWCNLVNISPTFIYMIVRDDIKNFASALVHTDKTTLAYVMRILSAKGLDDLTGSKEKLQKIIKSSKISKEQSDKMKAHIMNNVIDLNYIDYIRGTSSSRSLKQHGLGYCESYRPSRLH